MHDWDLTLRATQGAACVFRPSRSLVPQHRDHLDGVSGRSEATFCFRVGLLVSEDGRPARAMGSRGAPGQGVFGASVFRREGPFRAIRWVAWRMRSQMASAVVGSARYSCQCLGSS